MPPIASVRVLWRPEQFNRVTNPGIETNVTGWVVTAGINAAGTSRTRITSDAQSGSACMSVVCTSTDGSGVNWDFGSDRFFVEAETGAAYTAVVWLKRVSGSRRAEVILGSEGTSSDRASLTITDLTDQWQPYRIVWLPTGNRTDVQLAITNGSAAALTLLVDTVSVYQVDAFSQVENGWFSHDTTGWSIAAGGIAVAATSITRFAGASFAVSSTGAEIVTTAIAASGAEYDLGARLFTSGRTYRLRAGVQYVSGGGVVKMHLGSIGTPADRGVSNKAPSSGWEWHTVDWTPSADRTDVGVAFTNRTVTPPITTFRITEVEVYEAYDDLGTDAGDISWSRSLDGIGTIGVAVENADGLYDPRNTAGALYGSVAPGKRIWGRATWSNFLYPLFYGTLTTVEGPPRGGIHTDLLAEDMMGTLRDADTSMDFAQDTSYRLARAYVLNTVVSTDPVVAYAQVSDAHTSRANGIEDNTFYRGTDGLVPALDLLVDFNEATQTVHHIAPSVHANIGWVYTTVDRATLTDTSSDHTVDEDFTDLTGIRSTHETLENRQEVPWQGYEKLIVPSASESGFGLVMVARDPAVITYADSEDPYLHYTDEELGTDDDHPEPRFRLAGGNVHGSDWKGWKRWRRRRKRGLKIKRRIKVFRDAAVPFTMAAGEVKRYTFDFAIPVSGPQVLISDEGDAFITAAILIDYIEQTPTRIVVDLVCVSATTVANLEVYGTPWLPLDDLTETRNGFASQAAYGGIRTGPSINTAYIPAAGDAQGVGDYRNWRFGHPRLRPTLVDLFTDTNTRPLTVDLADHLTMSADRWRIDALLFVVQSCRWTVTQGGLEWRSGHDLEELPAHTAWFILDDASAGLDDAVVLAY